jgi:hypothetical protein
MHHILEGVCQYDIGLILKYMVFDFKYFTLEILNYRIETFSYGPIEIRNKPTLISENLKHGVIEKSAAESLCFTRYLGQLLSYRFLSSVENVYTIQIQFSRVLILDCFTLDYYNTRNIFLHEKFNFFIDDIIFISWINIKGTIYNCKNMCIIIDTNPVDTMRPSFGLIMAIFITDEKRPFTICEMYQTICFDENF